MTQMHSNQTDFRTTRSQSGSSGPDVNPAAAAVVVVVVEPSLRPSTLLLETMNLQAWLSRSCFPRWNIPGCCS
jgi:hypothetical protein